MRAYERLIRYAQVHTSSDESSTTVPSTACQFDLSLMLEQELRLLGFAAVYVDEHAYVYGVLPATAGMEDKPCIALIAHLDTIPDADFSGLNVQPQIVEDYNGGDLPLGESGRVLSPGKFPDLKTCVGHTLITTDGTTVLGADDKAGVAEIMTACEELLAENLPHGRIAVCFTPDEEIGQGADHFDVKAFGCDFAYTMDGGAVGELEFENFNAAYCKIHVHGVNVHPGSAYHKMQNSMRIAYQLAVMLPRWETPEHTQGYEGFYHLIGMNGTVEETTLSYIIRDHDRARFESRKRELEHLVRKVNREYGEGTAEIDMRDQYYNMREKIEPVMHIIDLAKQAMEAVGVTPVVKPIRGGTDGARLSFEGLPCPNIFAGGENFHSRYEYLPIPSMEKARDVILEIVKLLNC